MKTTTLAAVAFLLGGCGSDTVTVELNFPSADTFVRSESARILVVDIDAGQDRPIVIYR